MLCNEQVSFAQSQPHLKLRHAELSRLPQFSLRSPFSAPVIPPGGQTTIRLTVPYHWPFGFFPNSFKIVTQEPHSRELSPLWYLLPNCFPKRRLQFPLPWQRVTRPAQPPLSQRQRRMVQAPGPWLPLPGGQERAGSGFVSDASMMSPGPEPQEWVLTSLVPRTEPAEKKKSKQAGEKNSLLQKNTHMHRLK